MHQEGCVILIMDDCIMIKTDYVQQVINNHIKENFWPFYDKPIGRLMNTVYHRHPGVPNLHTASIKLGTAMEAILLELGNSYRTGVLFPRHIAGYGVSEEELQEHQEKKISLGKSASAKNHNSIAVYSRLSKIDLLPKIETLVLEKKAKKEKLTINEINEFSSSLLKQLPLDDEINEFFVDMCFLDNNVWVCSEIKSSGDTDSGKTQSTLTNNLLAPYLALGNVPKKLFFGIISNNRKLRKDGSWSGAMSRYLDKDLIKFDEEFLKMIFPPEELSYDVLMDLVEERLNKLHDKYKSVE